VTIPFSIDFLDDSRVQEWKATVDGVVAAEQDNYATHGYVAPRNPETGLDLTILQSVYAPGCIVMGRCEDDIAIALDIGIEKEFERVATYRDECDST
jgi:hypothetical protein